MAKATPGEKLDLLIPMRHPNNGTCDAYETDAKGRLLVPAEDAALMQAHGFVVAVEEA